MGTIIALSANTALIAAASATDTSIDVRGLPDWMDADNAWVVIDKGTPECEIRKVTSVTPITNGQRLGVAALTYSHAIGDNCSFITKSFANVNWFGTAGDGVTDDEPSFLNFFASGVRHFHLPGANYLLGKYVHIDTLSDILITGEEGTNIIYPSDDTGLSTDAVATTDTMVRSGFLLDTCVGVTIENVGFTGGNTVNAATNLGAAVYSKGSTFVKINECFNTDGGRLFFSDNTSTSYGNRLTNSTSRYAVNYISMGREFVVSDNYFEQNGAVGYDNPNTTHCLYLTAFHGKGKIKGNYFANYRTNAIKISGSSGAVSHYSILGNTFDDCARAIEFGADDTQRHDSCKIIGNDFINCATNKVNWNEGEAIRIWGSTGVIIANNNFFYDRNNIAGATGRYAIRISGSQTNQAAEDVLISGNILVGTATPASTLAAAINADKVGLNATDYGSLIIKDNIAQNIAATAFLTSSCLGLKLHGNEIRGINVLWNDTGSVFPMCVENRVHNTVTSNAKIRINATSFPIIRDNLSFEKGLGAASLVGVPANAGSSPVDHPLLGYKGRTLPLGTNETEVVFAFGFGWADGDTITVQGNTYTYGGGNDFTTSAGLIALIDAETGLTAEDYGAPWSITTAHIRVRSTSSIAVTVSTTVETAGILLPNNNTTQNRMDSKGSGVGNSVVWSPLLSFESAVTLIPDNAAAATLIAAGSYYKTAPGANDAGVAVLAHDNAAGTEHFRWSIV